MKILTHFLLAVSGEQVFGYYCKFLLLLIVVKDVNLILTTRVKGGIGFDQITAFLHQLRLNPSHHSNPLQVE